MSDSGTSRLVASVPPSHIVERLDWSADSRELVYTVKDGSSAAYTPSVWIADLDSGTSRQVAGDGYQAAGWRPLTGSREIAVVVDGGDVRVLNVDTGALSAQVTSRRRVPRVTRDTSFRETARRRSDKSRSGMDVDRTPDSGCHICHERCDLGVLGDCQHGRVDS